MPVNSDPPLEGVLLEPLDDRDGPARRISAEEFDAAVEAAVDRALLPRRRLGRKLPLLLAAAALCVTGLSAALFVTRPPWAGFSSSASTPPAARDTRAPGVTPPVASNPPAASAEPPAVAPVKAQGPAASARSPSAADLLQTANQLRRLGRWAEAERTYAQVASSYGGTSQGPVAALAAASLRLEHLGDPRGALRLYQTARRVSSLAAEAELGIANSYRALGEREAEIGALRRVVSAYPQAMFREQAAARLKALEAGKP
jgi:tetratricopeptide (TPR) repeat protein